MENAIVTTDLPPAKARFLELLSKKVPFYEICVECFPEKDDPFEYGLKIMKEYGLGKVAAFKTMQEVGLSIPETIHEFKNAYDLAKTNPKSSTALLNCVKMGFDFYDLLPKQERQFGGNTNNIQINLNTPEGRKQVTDQYYEQAQKELPKEEIDKFVESGTIGEVEVLEKSDLFINGDEE